MAAYKYAELEKRVFNFSKSTRLFCYKLKVDRIKQNDIIQLIRSSGSVCANYIEANESLGTKDFLMRLRIVKKEAKESLFWMRIIEETFILNDSQLVSLKLLIKEANEIMKIFAKVLKLNKPLVN